MSEDLVIAQCSPTMAGLKTGSLFVCPMQNKQEMNDGIRKMNKRLVPRGVRLLPLKYLKDGALIYMYRPSLLKRDLTDKLAVKILSQKGYPVENAQLCIAELIRRLNCRESFPHEIGLFLGYPSEDVDGFISNGAKYAKCVGTWKVYGDEEKAKRKFAQFKKCTKLYCESYRRNNSFDRLVVSCS